MKILCVNAGSSSLKFQLYEMPEEKVLISGYIEKIGQPDCFWNVKVNGEKIKNARFLENHTEAVKVLIEELFNHKVVESLEEIKGVGHRVLHGGEKYSDSVIITDEVIENIVSLTKLGPLHHPGNLAGINAMKEALPEVPMVAVYDTAFHQTMPEKAYMYGLPYEYYDKYKVRRFGFHGTSHSFVSKRTAEFLGRAYDDTKTIVCHLGNGASICAVLNGKSVDTSMGLTPLEGLVMGTRSGDVDPGALEFLAKKEGLDITGLLNMLNKKSGVHGLSGISSDFRDLAAGAEAGNKQAQIAIEVFAYRVAKYVGSYVAAMNGVDAIAFTAGIGENDGSIREKVCSYLGYLGITIDKEANSKRGEEIVISTADSKVKVLVIPTNEELAIARETVALV